MPDSSVGQSARPADDRPVTVLDIDNEHFKRHVTAIHKEIEALLNLYLGPRTRGRVADLAADLNELVAEHSREQHRARQAASW